MLHDLLLKIEQSNILVKGTQPRKFVFVQVYTIVYMMLCANYDGMCYSNVPVNMRGVNFLSLEAPVIVFNTFIHKWNLLR